MKHVIVIDLDNEEKGIMINALNEFRNKLLEMKIDTEPVDCLLLKLLDAPEKKRMFPRKYLEVR
ncbi:MAG: hypothetical protein J6D03_07735 [Clostridia bacterium]|nr:hypothetical protein [Clostridia bacterium]MBO5530544.1 hypothetical protein [Bacilli bacterium]